MKRIAGAVRVRGGGRVDFFFGGGGREGRSRRVLKDPNAFGER